MNMFPSLIEFGYATDFRPSDLGFTRSNRIYINESFTAKDKQLFYEVKTYTKLQNFKYIIWSRNGNFYLRKDDEPTTESVRFKNLKDFQEFKAKRTMEHIGSYRRIVIYFFAMVFSNLKCRIEITNDLHRMNVYVTSLAYARYAQQDFYHFIILSPLI